MKRISNYLLSILALFFALQLRSQSGGHSPSLQLTPKGIFDVVYDGNGNTYSLADINIGSATFGGTTSAIISATCQAGYFTLHFDQGSQFFHNNNSAQTLTCKVFNDISSFITSSITPGAIHIHCDDEVQSLATCGQYYVMPWNPINYNPGIVDGQVQKALLSGSDPFANIPISFFNANAYYHGKLTVQPTSTNIIWNYDVSTTNINSNEYDLYSVLLHEVTHALGFQSLMKVDGKSDFSSNVNPSNNYFGRYDKFLHDHAGNPLLVATSSACPTTSLTFGPSSTTVLSTGQQTSSVFQNTTSCLSAAMYSSTAVGTVAVHTPHFFNGSSLEHFEDICSGSYGGTCTSAPGANDLYFVTSNFAGTGSCYVKRHLTPEERLVLCDLGYTVASTYGGSSVAGSFISYGGSACNPPTVYGINDGLLGSVYTLTTTGTTMAIPYSFITQNDIPNYLPKPDCMESVYNTSTLALGSNDFTVSAAAGSGVQLIKYYPNDYSNNFGNATYLFVYFSPAGCIPTSNCNYVNNGGFEYSQGSPQCGNIGVSGRSFDCWEVYQGQSGMQGGNIFGTTCSNSATYEFGQPAGLLSASINTLNFGSVSNNQVLGLEYHQNSTAALKNYLNTPLAQSFTYQLTFWVINAESHSQNATLNLANDPVVISVATHTASVFSPTLNFPVGLDVISNFVINASNTWAQITHTFVYSNSVSANVLLIGINSSSTAMPSNFSLGGGYMCLIDEVSLTQLPSVSLTIPSASICTNEGITDLELYASLGGTFTGAGVTFNNGQYDFNSPPTLTPGVYPVAFSYTTGNCTNTIYESVTVQNCCLTGTMPSYTTTSVSGIQNWTGGQMKIVNSVTVANGGHLKLNAEFLIEPGVTITVASGGTLVLGGAHLHACSSMWNGIKVLDGGKLIMQQESGIDNLIEDAITAIDASDQFTTSVGTFLDISNTTFNRNSTGIRITNYDGSSNSNTNPLSLINCVFTSRFLPFTVTSWPQTGTTNTSATYSADLRAAINATTGLAAPYLAQDKFTVANLKGLSHPSQVAIDLQNVGVTNTAFNGITIGEQTTGNFNVFDAHALFIKAESSNVTSHNNVFQNTQTRKVVKSFGPPVLYKTVGGAAIEANANSLMNCELDVSGSTAATANRFYDCHKAIIGAYIFVFTCENNIFRSSGNSTVTATPGTFPTGESAIGINTNRFNYRVNGCEFTNIARCIDFPLGAGQYTTAATGTVINNGIYASFIGVKQNTFSPGAGSSNYISSAVRISCANAFTPVVITNTNVSPPASGIAVEDNILNPVFRGINISGITGLHTEVRTNTIALSADIVSGFPQYGIKLSNCISGTSMGFDIAAHKNLVSGSGTNSMSVNEALFHASFNSGISSPSICCNTLGDSHTGFRFEGYNSHSIWAGNVMNPLIRGLELHNNGVIGQQGHSQTASANIWKGAWGAGNFGTWVGMANPSLSIAASTAKSSTLYVTNTSSFVPPNNGGSAAPQERYGTGNNTIKSVVGGDYDCGGNPNNIVLPVPDNDTYAAGTMFSIAENLLYRYMRLDPGSCTPANGLLAYYESLEESSAALLMKIEEKLYNGVYTEARNLNLDFEPRTGDLCEASYKEYYRLYANYLEEWTSGEYLSVADSTALMSLALLCPGANGPAIYQARALFNFIYVSHREFGDCEGSPGVRKRQLQEAISLLQSLKKWQIDLFPNPARNQVEVRSSVTSEMVQARIMDVSGRVIASYELEITDHSAILPLALNDGLYFVHIKNHSNEECIEKLVISH